MSFDRFKYVIIICVLIGTLPLFSQVEVRLDSLQNIVSSRRYNSVEKIRSLLEMADIHYYLDYNDEMLEDINKAKVMLNKVKDNCLRLEVEYVESKYYYSIRMPQECQKRTERLLLLAQEEKCTTIEVNLLLQLSKLNLQKDKLDSSDYYIKAAKGKAINVGDSILMAKTDLMAAYLFYLENDNQKSIDILLPA